jgi:nucleoside-diphosphate-sugar epimerase
VNTALVIGGSGCLGSALVNNLVAKGWRVSTAGRNLGKSEVFEHLYLDLELPIQIPEEKRYDFVYYFAQDQNFRNYPDSITTTFQINSYSALSISNWAKKNAGKFVYASTGSVYARKDSALVEKDDYEISNNLSPYVLSKILAEQLILKSNETSLILRPFFIYGPESDNRMLIPSLIDSIKKNKEIQVDQHGGITINPVYSLDAAEAIFLIQEGMSGFVNVAGEESLSIFELSNKIANTINLEPQFRENYSESQRILMGNIDIIKSKGWKQAKSFSENIRQLVASN